MAVTEWGSKNAAIKPWLTFVWGKIIHPVKHCIALNSYPPPFPNLFTQRRKPRCYRSSKTIPSASRSTCSPLLGGGCRGVLFPPQPGALLTPPNSPLWCPILHPFILGHIPCTAPWPAASSWDGGCVGLTTNHCCWGTHWHKAPKA